MSRFFTLDARFVLGLYLEGEPQALMALGFFVVVLVVLGLLSWFIVRRSKARYGRRAYLMGTIPFALAGMLFFAEYEWEKPSAGPPKVFGAEEFHRMVAGLPKEAHLSLAGVGFFDGKLYVGTNLGLLEVVQGKVTRLFQFQSRDSVVSGPWVDRADHLLWLMDEDRQELVSFDGRQWRRMEKPPSSKGYYSRGDAGEGMRFVGDAGGFWMSGSETAWKWDRGASQWRQIAAALPRPPGYDEVRELLGPIPAGPQTLLLVRHQPLAYIKTQDGRFHSDELEVAGDPGVSSIPRDAKPFLADSWTVAQGIGYICTQDGRLIQATKDRVSEVATEGPCKTVANDEAGNLLVGVRSKGIFRYAAGSWDKIAGFGAGAGSYWFHLAAEGAQAAVAIEGKPIIDRANTHGSDMRFVTDTQPALYTLSDGRFVPVGF